MERYPVFDIKRYSINDGPGIRITFFFKGCPLSCIWCHNPEGISFAQTRLYSESKCLKCGTCVRACPVGAIYLSRGILEIDQDLCRLCGTCAEVCPSKAMEMAVRNLSAEEIYTQIKKERPFFRTSGGGVTFSGGEPLTRGKSLLRLLDYIGEQAAQDGYELHRTVDTTLYAPSDLVAEVAGKCELFLVDLKHMDSGKHRKFCGVPNELIHENIRMISEMGAKFIVRIPLIGGINADEDNIRASAEFLSVCGKPLVELLPYHDIGKNKHVKLGSIYNKEGVEMYTPSPSEIDRIISIFGEYGVPARIG